MRSSKRKHRAGELAFQFGPNPSPAEGIARWTAYAAFGLFSFGVAMGITGTFGTDLAVGTMLLGAVTTVIAGLVAAHRYQRRRDLVGERWLRFWKSRMGEWAARLAGLGLKRTFENLPDAARKALEDLPDVLRRLELQTQGMRTWIAELDGTASAREVEVRDAAQQRLAETVTAVETIRLQLLRLHDGTGTVESLTAELAAARKIGDAVDRLLEGRREVQDALNQRPGGP